MAAKTAPERLAKVIGNFLQWNFQVCHCCFANHSLDSGEGERRSQELLKQIRNGACAKHGRWYESLPVRESFEACCKKFGMTGRSERKY